MELLDAAVDRTVYKLWGVGSPRRSRLSGVAQIFTCTFALIIIFTLGNVLSFCSLEARIVRLAHASH